MNVARKDLTADASPAKQKIRKVEPSSLTWTEKYKPKVPNDIIGNQSLVSQSLIFSFAIDIFDPFNSYVGKLNINLLFSPYGLLVRETFALGSSLILDGRI